MADLAKVQSPIDASRQKTDNNDALLPTRRQVDQPRLEVNAAPPRQNNSAAQRLSEILGLVDQAASVGVNALQNRQAEKDKKASGAGALAGATGHPDPVQLAKNKQYADAYYTSGAERTALETDTQIKQRVTDRLADTDHPATIDDINHIVDEEYGLVALDEHGNVRDLGSPHAQMVIANAAVKTRGDVLGTASDVIRKQTNEKLITNIAFVAVNNGLPELKPKGSEFKPSVTPAIAGNLTTDIRYRAPNPDGSVSTVRTISIGTDKGEVLIPTVIDGKVVSNEEAIAHYKQTGENFGTFATVAAADAYAADLHNYHAGLLASEKAPKDALSASFDAAFSVGPSGDVQKVTDAKTGKPLAGHLVGTRMPLRGSVTDSYRAHLARGSHGLDIAAPEGSAVVLPFGGKVIEVDDTGAGKSGKFVRVEHPGGVITSYSHLSRIDVAVGQQLADGADVGKVGHTGHATGPHLHYRIKVNGKDVNPAAFKWDGVPAAPGANGGTPDPALAASLDHGTPGEKPSYTPRYDFEYLMGQIPLTVPRAEAKAGLIKALIVNASEQNRPDLLRGITHSTRADGTPSFNPDEMFTLNSEADRIEAKGQADAKRRREERWDSNSDRVITSILDGHDVSQPELTAMVDRGDLDPRFAYSLIQHQKDQQRQDQREAVSDQKVADREADNELDMDVGSRAAQRQAGDLRGSSQAEDMKLLNSGALGTGKAAIRRYRLLRAATLQGAQVVEQSPTARAYAGQLEDNFKIQPKFVAGMSLLNRQTGVPRATHDAAMAAYSTYLSQGMTPAVAFHKVMTDYGPKDGADPLAAMKARAAELRSKQ